MLSTCSHDEIGRYIGGKAGDQTGSEYAIVNWYDYPFGGWNYVLHFPDSNIRALIAKLAMEAPRNDLIGYDQSERYTFWEQLEQSGYRPANIQSPCEADCSSSTAAIVKAVGYLSGNEKLKAVSIYAWTGNIRPVLTEAGFQCFNGTKYLTSGDYLYAGDIVLNEENHVVICVRDGAKVGEGEKEYFTFKSRQVSLGYKGRDVYVAQCALKARTFYAGTIDAKFGDGTDSAVRRFQRKAGLVEDGLFGYKSQSKLYGLQYVGYKDGYYLWAIKQTEKDTDHTDSAMLMQEMLKIKKFYKGALDGEYKNKTVTAVKEFQKKYKKLGLEVTGKCDLLTIEKIMTPTSELKKQLEAVA